MKVFLLALAVAIQLSVWSADRKAAVRYDFSDAESIKKAWEFHCGVFMVPRTVYRVEHCDSALNKKVLVVESNAASGVLMTDPKVNLRKFPIMRWRWRLIRPVVVRAGTKEPDDQAGAIYIGDGTMVSQKSIAYRWECNTPVGTRQSFRYGGGMMHVRAECVRNRETKIGEWVTEERDVLADFIRAYKRFPGEYFILGVGANSQNSKSRTRLEIDYIEFIPRKKQ